VFLQLDTGAAANHDLGVVVSLIVVGLLQFKFELAYALLKVDDIVAVDILTLGRVPVLADRVGALARPATWKTRVASCFALCSFSLVATKAACIRLYTLGRTCLQREHAVSVCATRDELSSAALSLSLALPLAGPAVTGACMAADAGQRRRWVSLQQGDYWFRQTPHAVARTRPQLLVLSHKADSLSLLLRAEDPLLSLLLLRGDDLDQTNTCRVPTFNLVYLSMSLRQRLVLPFFRVPCRYCFLRIRIGFCSSPDRLQIREQDHQIQQRWHEKAVTIFRHAV
jgi:hypothetical protein